MKRLIFQELRNVKESDDKIIEDYKRKEENIVVAKCNIKIKDKEIKAIIDIRTARNIMSKALKEKLGLKIQSLSKVKFKLADGSRVPSLGEIEIKIKIKEIRILIRVHILESLEENLLLEIEQFFEIGAKIDFKLKLLKINDKRRKIKISIIITRKDEEEYKSENKIEDEAYYSNSTDSEIKIVLDDN